jgi:hypothetical protein
MATATCNGLPVLLLEIVEPLQGNWVATIDVDASEALAATVVLDVAGTSWSGTVVRSGVDGGHVRALVEGGSGGLRQELGAKYYSGPALDAIVRDAASETAETLATDCDDMRALVLPRYQRTKCWAAGALTCACSKFGLTWRVKRDGTLWVGTDSWTEVAPSEATELVPLPGSGARVYAVSEPVLRPGTTFRGERISTALTQLGPTALRQEVWLAGT